MKTFGLIGYRLGHSFSKNYFTEKFRKEKLENHEYLNFELDKIEDFPLIFEGFLNISGLNCTIPYKQQIMQYMDEIDSEALEIGAVNTVKIIKANNKVILKGYNTDIYGFEKSIEPMLSPTRKKALILGTGGAAKSVKYSFNRKSIDFLSVTSKQSPGNDEILYSDITKDILSEYKIIINATPLGTFPNEDTCPDLPYEFLSQEHVLFDLVYNPEITLFMKKGIEKGAKIKNGLEMLHLQAEKAWEIWNDNK